MQPLKFDYVFRFGMILFWFQMMLLHAFAFFGFRTGNLVIFNLQGLNHSRVGMVLTIWKGTKKPKVFSKQIGLSHVSVLRVVSLTRENQMWKCNGTSSVHMLGPESLVAILNCESSEERDGECFVTVSPESGEVIEALKFSGEWWVHGIKEPKEPKVKKATVKKVKQKKNIPKPPVESETVPKPKKRAKKLKKPSTSDASMVAIPENFRKTQAGKELIKAVLERLRKMDEAAHKKEPIFDGHEKCLLKMSKCKGVPWSHILERSFEYFRVEWLDYA